MDGITDSLDVSVSKLQEMGKDGEAWCAAVHGLRGFHVRDRHTDDLTAGVLETRDLGDGGSDVRGR